MRTHVCLRSCLFSMALSRLSARRATQQEDSLEKALAARAFFEDFYASTGAYVVDRAQRRTELNERIAAEGLAPAAASALRDDLLAKERMALRGRFVVRLCVLSVWVRVHSRGMCMDHFLFSVCGGVTFFLFWL